MYDTLTRPVELVQEPKIPQQKIPIETLYSDPVVNQENDNIPNPERDGYGNFSVPRCGIARLQKFMNDNNLEIIIRSHEPVIEGVENMGNVITVFSATNYCGVL
jgi:hypothetical protein